jgi:SET domain-containing protein
VERAERLTAGWSGQMQVPYDVKPSTYGSGVFAAADIAAGQLIWRFDAANVVLMLESEARDHVAEAGPEELRRLLEYSYWSSDTPSRLVDLSSDDGRFFNHASSATCRNVALGSAMGMMDCSENRPGEVPGSPVFIELEFDSQSTYATRDIVEGEELLDNYNEYGSEPQWYVDILAKNGVDTSYMKSK